MLSSIQSLFGKKNNSPTESNISVRSPDEIESLEKTIKVGPVTFVLVHADWCGPCQGYKPIWKELENSPGRKANMAMIHHDMVENSSTLKNAKIPGYPSVLKVYQNGHIEEYKGEGNKKTNSMPNIRDTNAMEKELSSKVLNISSNKSRNNRNSFPTRKSLFNKQPIRNMAPRYMTPQPFPPQQSQPFPPQQPQPFPPQQSQPLAPLRLAPPSLEKRTMNYNKQLPASEIARRNLTNSAISVTNTLVPSSKNKISIGATVPPMKGGLYTALSQALLKAGPASVLFAASQMLPPKKNRGSTMRLTRKSKKMTRKN